MTTLSTPVSSLVVASPPSDVFHKTSEPVEIFSQAAGINAVVTEIKDALGHVDLVTAGATTPAAGHKGEKISAAVLVANAAPLTTATPLTIASISLSAGDWTIDGSAQLSLAAATCTIASAGTSLTTNAADLDQYTTRGILGTTTATATVSQPIPTRHIQVAAATSIFLVAAATFSAGAVSAYGVLNARRAS
jgi:hypothetical protein